jgi:hypothetical protein
MIDNITIIDSIKLLLIYDQTNIENNEFFMLIIEQLSNININYELIIEVDSEKIHNE